MWIPERSQSIQVEDVDIETCYDQISLKYHQIEGF